jgi:hypothetical protein
VSARIFVSQGAVERWAAEGRVELTADAVSPSAGPLAGRRFPSEPAVHVLGLAGGGGDEAGLVGRVKRVAELRAMGAELVGASILAGEAAYDVEPGFLVTLDAESARLVAARRVASERPLEGEAPDGQSDAEALARFLLNTLP